MQNSNTRWCRNSVSFSFSLSSLFSIPPSGLVWMCKSFFGRRIQLVKGREGWDDFERGENVVARFTCDISLRIYVKCKLREWKKSFSHFLTFKLFASFFLFVVLDEWHGEHAEMSTFYRYNKWRRTLKLLKVLFVVYSNFLLLPDLLLCLACCHPIKATQNLCTPWSTSVVKSPRVECL